MNPSRDLAVAGNLGQGDGARRQMGDRPPPAMVPTPEPTGSDGRERELNPHLPLLYLRDKSRAESTQGSLHSWESSARRGPNINVRGRFSGAGNLGREIVET